QAAPPPPRPLAGTVFLDRNGDGQRQPGEPGVAGARVSDQKSTVLTDARGEWSIAEAGGYGVVYASAPADYRVAGSFWRTANPGDAAIDFALVEAPSPHAFTFIHASDPHASAASVERLRAA